MVMHTYLHQSYLFSDYHTRTLFSAPIYTIPVYRMLPIASIDALTALAHAETNSSDEAGELFSMVVAVKVPAAQVPPNSVIIIPLGRHLCRRYFYGDNHGK